MSTSMVLASFPFLALIHKFLCYYLTFLLLIPNTAADDGNGNRFHGSIINVTKHIFFPEFSLSAIPSTNHEVKLLGSARVSSGRGVIQIPDPSRTEDIRHQAGRAIYSSPIRVFDPPTRTPASFETTFSFQLTNCTLPSSYCHNPDEAYGGSGLTFLITPDEFTVGRPGPWLGMLNDACESADQKFVAVEFDTRQNPEVNDPNDNHIGINLGSILSTATVDASDLGLFFKDGSIHQTTISYDGPRKWIKIRIGSSHQNFTPKTAFSGELDLSPFLNEYMFVGFSASTGNKTQIHNLLSWNFTSTSPAFLRLPSPLTCETKFLAPNESTSTKFSSEEEEPSETFIAFVSVVAVLFAAMIFLFYYSRRKRSSNEAKIPDLKLRPQPPNRPRRFTAAEILTACRGFSEQEILVGGEDSGGIVYRGTLMNGCHVAVKRFSGEFLSSMNVDKRRFTKRMKQPSRVKHENLLPVRGWCCNEREFAVVYEYMFNGCLDKWLFGVGVLPWSRRFEVVKDVAAGLTYLHSRQLGHNNVRVSSIFLDVDFKAVLGDFGLRGDPIGLDLGVLRSADVFDFGVFLLEVVAGRRKRWSESDMNPDPDLDTDFKRMDLLDLAWVTHERGEKMKVVDRRMGSGINSDQAIRVVDIGLLCTLNEGNGRPNMVEVTKYLNTDSPMPELPPNRPVVLCPYNSGPSLCGGYVCAPF
ncbi:hypothetical protein Ancab_010107 [Ancistrocladus abbreviatus]